MAGQIAVVGATGVTGAFAFAEAHARGLAPLAIGRDPAKLDAFLSQWNLGPKQRRVADVHDPASLKRALNGVAVVVSCVGPFVELGFPVAKAAAELGLGYTDSTGEPAFMQRLIDELDQTAIRTGATLATGNGATAFLGDIAIHWITDNRRDSSGSVLYDIRAYRPSHGSIESYLNYIMPAGGALLRDGNVTFRPLGAFAGQVAGRSAIHGAFPDPLVISRYWPARRLDAMLPAPAWARPVLHAGVRAIVSRPIRQLILRLPLKRLAPYDPTAADRSTVTALAEFRGHDGSVRHRQLRGSGVYPLTAAALIATAQGMLAADPRPAGVRAASEMFDSFDQAVRLAGLTEITVS